MIRPKSKVSLQKRSKYSQGLYVVKNPDKYMGDLRNVIFRSSYEQKLNIDLDTDSNVIRWCAEPPFLQIKYWDELKKKFRTYHLDYFVVKMVNGVEMKLMIEVKPSKKLVKPLPPKVRTLLSMKSYQYRMAEWINIHSKRKACEELAKKMGWTYLFVTEKTINKL
jgi:hypothetical protein